MPCILAGHIGTHCSTKSREIVRENKPQVLVLLTRSLIFSAMAMRRMGVVVVSSRTGVTCNRLSVRSPSIIDMHRKNRNPARAQRTRGNLRAEEENQHNKGRLTKAYRFSSACRVYSNKQKEMEGREKNGVDHTSGVLFSNTYIN